MTATKLAQRDSGQVSAIFFRRPWKKVEIELGRSRYDFRQKLGERKATDKRERSKLQGKR
jgi:hypothetical protein